MRALEFTVFMQLYLVAEGRDGGRLQLDPFALSESEIYRRFEAEGDLLRERPSTVEFFEGEAPSAADASRIVTSILLTGV